MAAASRPDTHVTSSYALGTASKFNPENSKTQDSWPARPPDSPLALHGPARFTYPTYTQNDLASRCQEVGERSAAQRSTSTRMRKAGAAGIVNGNRSERRTNLAGPPDHDRGVYAIERRRAVDEMTTAELLIIRNTCQSPGLDNPSSIRCWMNRQLVHLVLGPVLPVLPAVSRFIGM